MNKTVTVNLGGMVFHIDEDAYEILSNYLRSIRMHFGNSDGAREIISDIESRFAELFNGKLNEGKQVIVKADVDDAIAKMGKPEDIAGEAGESFGTKSDFTYSSGGKKSKRFYRNPDDKVLGGVCGGIGSYFDFDPLWLRLAFAVSFFFFGSGFLLYLVLWLIIPKAKTTAEKLEMRGEEVNIGNIEKAIKEEFENLKDQFREFKKEGRGFSKSHGVKTAKNFLEEVFDFVTQVISTLIKAVMKIFGVFFIILGFFVLLILGAALMQSMGLMEGSSILTIHGSGYHSHNLSELTDIFFSSQKQLMMAVIALFLLVGVPFLRMMVWGIKILFRIHTRDFFVNVVFSILWGIGLLIGILVIVDLGSDFSREAEVVSTVPLQKINSSVIYINGIEHDDESYDDQDTSSLHFNNVSLKIVKGTGPDFEIEKTNLASGKNLKEGMNRANAISYSITQKDSLVLIDPLIHLSQGEKFRNQKIRITLKVPEGKSVNLGYDLENVALMAKNDQSIRTKKMLGHTWMMTEKKLSCRDCSGY